LPTDQPFDARISGGAGLLERRERLYPPGLREPEYLQRISEKTEED